MSQCLNPDCLYQNLPKTVFCQRCGSKMVLGDRYRAVRPIGEGGFGRTFQAVDEHRLDTPCVIKQFLPQQSGSGALEKATELFKQEAFRLRDLGKHSQIPDLLAFFQQEGRLYLIQEFIEGDNLLDELQQKGKLREPEVKKILTDLLPILQFIHDNKVIHRDIKPENIIRSSQTGVLFIIDFGISKEITSRVITKIGTITGTPGYAPPEQFRGMVYPNSDLYSLAITCIRLLTGYFPQPDGYDALFDSMRMQWVWKQHISISNELCTVLDKMLQDLPINRFQTATEILSVLRSLQLQEIAPQVVSPKQPQIYSSPKHKATPPLKPPIPSTLPVKLVSTMGVDYQPLYKFLEQGNWKDANEETAKVMLKAVRKKEGDRFRVEDVDQFPCEDLRIIDSLWVKHSKGHFGFSVQKRIYQSLGGTKIYNLEVLYSDINLDVWEKFSKTVGWKKRGFLGLNYWLYYSDITFDITAKQGHLPTYPGLNELSYLAGFGFLFSRVESCKL
ncbi:serine/threonine-protein kinase [Nodularia spumigena]|uniref:serine/threonine-protein kinase n=1 Tax=Nodularia spumigena TaxID=70799 RepID=UPI002B1ED1A2|nr:serine/threonine-protein kinase [Nodularia spumigena]MEA5556410.1 serine/threonine-protein kinase [Nodularia spumigena CH309]